MITIGGLLRSDSCSKASFSDAASLDEDARSLVLQSLSFLTGDFKGRAHFSSPSGYIFFGVALLSPVLEGPGDAGHFFGELSSASVDDRCLLRGVPLITGAALPLVGDFMQMSCEFGSVLGGSSSSTH